MRVRRPSPSVKLVAALAALVACVLPGGAWAGTVEGAPGLVTFTADSGEANELVVIASGPEYVLVDLGAPLAVAGDCVSESTHRATCPVEDRELDLDLGDGDDEASVTVFHDVTLLAGDGEDTIAVTALNLFCCDGDGDFFTTSIDGGAGNDSLTAGPGNHRLDGGEGDDEFRGAQGAGATFVGGPGADTFHPSRGWDVVSYAERTAPVVADADGVADDGEAGEGDNILPGPRRFAGIDMVRGGQAADVLTGGGFLRTLAGGAGDDLIDLRPHTVGDGQGGPGDDTLLGGSGGNDLSGQAGNDSLDGGDGNDWLEGGPGDDTLLGGAGRDDHFGGAGADRIVGGSGRDWAFGGPGSDVLRMRDGEHDDVWGGGGIDRARVDRGLDTVRSVETRF